MGKQPPLLEILHHTADGGRGQVDAADQGLRTNRNPTVEIGLDHEAEDIAHAVGQFADWLGHGAASRIDGPAGLGTQPHQYQETSPYAPIRTRPRPDA